MGSAWNEYMGLWVYGFTMERTGFLWALCLHLPLPGEQGIVLHGHGHWSGLAPALKRTHSDWGFCTFLSKIRKHKS